MEDKQLCANHLGKSTTSKTLMLGRCRQYGDLRLLEVTEERNGPSGLRDDDGDDAFNAAGASSIVRIKQSQLYSVLKPVLD